jgi:hypothetical protein
MPARRPARWAFPGTAVVVLSCAALTGCGGFRRFACQRGRTQRVILARWPRHRRCRELTGNFCTDFKNIGGNMPIPAGSCRQVRARLRSVTHNT